jgi:hypothetical protein
VFESDKLKGMKCLILILFLSYGIYAETSSGISTVLPILEPETLTDLPKEAIDDFERVTIQARQNEVEEELEIEAELTDEPVVTSSTTETTTTTAHFTQLACTGQHMEWNSCGPRCYQTCAFQPQDVRRSRAVCETPNSSGCHAGCFCKSGFVRFNEKCVLPVDCPSKLNENSC